MEILGKEKLLHEMSGDFVGLTFMNTTAEPRLSNREAKKVPHSTQIADPVKIDMTGGRSTNYIVWRHKSAKM